jgi:drug/metabolite transporter (DMT)-like permease
VASAFAYTSVRALKSYDHELVIVFYFPLVSLPIVTPLALAKWQWPQGWDWLLVFVVGVFTFLAQLFMTKAYQRDRAADIGIYNYLGIFFALGFGYFFFDESFAWPVLSGMVLILAAVYLATQSRPKSFQAFLKR